MNHLHRTSITTPSPEWGIDRDTVEILAPTWLEYLAVRHTLPTAQTSWTGIRLTRWKGVPPGSNVIVCGLAGALTPNLLPGTVLVPERIGLVDGRSVQCDPTLVAMLRKATYALHFQPHMGPLLTAPTLIREGKRADWSQQGFVAADMETGLLIDQNLRIATIRIVLDGPEQDISAHWLRPMQALLHPAHWREMCWLGCTAPRYALRAAHILHLALSSESGSIIVE